MSKEADTLMADTLNDTRLPIAVAPGAPDGAHVMPSGNWIVARDPKLLTRGDRKEFIRAGNDPDLSATDGGFHVYDLIAAKLITAWSYPFPVPAERLDVMDQLPIEDDVEVGKLVKAAEALLFPQPVTPDDHADPASPSGPSSD